MFARGNQLRPIVGGSNGGAFTYNLAKNGNLVDPDSPGSNNPGYTGSISLSPSQQLGQGVYYKFTNPQPFIPVLIYPNDPQQSLKISSVFFLHIPDCPMQVASINGLASLYCCSDLLVTPWDESTLTWANRPFRIVDEFIASPLGPSQALNEKRWSTFTYASTSAGTVRKNLGYPPPPNEPAGAKEIYIPLGPLPGEFSNSPRFFVKTSSTTTTVTGGLNTGSSHGPFGTINGVTGTLRLTYTDPISLLAVTVHQPWTGWTPTTVQIGGLTPDAQNGFFTFDALPAAPTSVSVYPNIYGMSFDAVRESTVNAGSFGPIVPELLPV